MSSTFPEQTAGAFKDVRSIANAYKHLYTSTDSRKAAHASVSSAGAIVSVELMDSDSEIASLFEDYDGARAAVVFVRKDGSKAEFLPVLDKVLDYWRGALCEGA
jgi:hypothetical protein